MDKNKVINVRRQRREFHTRRKVRGTVERPRLTVFRSHKNIYCQIVDDVARRTLVSASTKEPEVKSSVGYGGNKPAAQIVGRKLAERALAAGIKQVCFDRGHLKYHGRVAALADAAREAGLSF
ncbi:MAG: 50S ribosomal protein L18 [Pirellulaceae bacterium]